MPDLSTVAQGFDSPGPLQASTTAQYTTTQTSTVIGPTVAATEQLVLMAIQIDAGGTTAGDVQVYFGTGAYARGTNRAIYDGGFKPSSTARPNYSQAYGPWGLMGAVGDEVRVTTSAALNPLTITIWYYVFEP